MIPNHPSLRRDAFPANRTPPHWVARICRTPLAVTLCALLTTSAGVPVTAGQDVVPPAASACDRPSSSIDAAEVCLVVVNAGLRAGAVDVSIGDDRPVVGLASGSRGAALLLAAEPVTIRFHPSGDRGTVLAELVDVELIGAALNEVALLGDPAAGSARALVLPPVAPSSVGGDTTLRLVQGIADAPPLTVSGRDGTAFVPLIADLGVGTTVLLPDAQIPPGLLILTVGGSGDVLATVAIDQLPGVGLSTAYLVGTLTNPAAIHAVQVVTSGPPVSAAAP